MLIQIIYHKWGAELICDKHSTLYIRTDNIIIVVMLLRRNAFLHCVVWLLFCTDKLVRRRRLLHFVVYFRSW